MPGAQVAKAASAGWSPVTASEEFVYVGTRQGKVQALADDGFKGVLVKLTFPPEASAERLPAVHNPPVLGNKLLYISSYDGYLYAVDRATLQTGESGWRRPTTQATKPLVGGPALDAEQKVVAVGSEDGGLHVYNATSGEPLPWSPFVTGDKIWSTPLIANGVIYFGSHDQNVYAVSLADGKKLWSFPTGGAVVARPMLFQDTLVVGSFDRRLYGINAKDGSLRWEFQAGNWFWAGAVTNGKTIFAPSMDGNLYALDAAGGLLWSHPMGAPIVSTPALVARGLVVASRAGKVSLLDINPASLGAARELSSRTFPGASITAPLSAAGDSVYMGAQDNTVRRIQVKDTLNEVWCVRTQAKDDSTKC